jgi:NitT/TauT family transport system substrate-binding protein
MMKRCTSFTGLQAAFLCGVLAAGALAGAANAADKVTFNMSWLPQGSMSGIAVAIDKGYYADAGLEVEAVRGFGGIRTTNEIDQGLFEFGYGNPLGVILNRSKGGKTRMIGSINNRWPGGLCYVKERHEIRTPADLEGLTVGGGQYSPVQVMMPAWLERNGVSSDSITLLQMDPAVVDASLVEGKIDAAECWLGSNKAVIEKIAIEAGVTIDWIEYEAHNLDIYGSGIVTSDKLIEDNPDLVQRFVAATYEGYAYANEHPEEATDILLKQFPVLERDVTLQQVRETAELIASDRLGAMEEDRMISTLEFLTSAYSVTEDIKVVDIYTTRFVD